MRGPEKQPVTDTSRIPCGCQAMGGSPAAASIRVASPDISVLIRFVMKQYVIDDLRLEDFHKLKDYLDEHLASSPLGGVYWLELDRDILTRAQKEHTECGPHVFALMLEETRLSCEFLVRIQKKIKCDCMAYADKAQQNWLMDQADAILEKLDIRI